MPNVISKTNISYFYNYYVYQVIFIEDMTAEEKAEKNVTIPAGMTNLGKQNENYTHTSNKSSSL